MEPECRRLGTSNTGQCTLDHVAELAASTSTRTDKGERQSRRAATGLGGK